MSEEEIKAIAVQVAQIGAQREPVPDDPKLAYYRGITDTIALFVTPPEKEAADDD